MFNFALLFQDVFGCVGLLQLFDLEKGFCFIFLKCYWSVVDNVVLVSGVQRSDSVIHIHVSTLFQIF